MPILHTKNEYLIQRGRAYFDPYNASEELTGEIDLGNCPGISLSIETEKAMGLLAGNPPIKRQGDFFGPFQVDCSVLQMCEVFA